MENPARKRRRPAVACTECRRRKVKCDRASPCGPCVLSSLICAYNSSSLQFTALTSDPAPGSAVRQETGSDWEPSAYFANVDNQTRFYGVLQGGSSNTNDYSGTGSSTIGNNSLLSSADTSLTASTNSNDLQSVPTSTRLCLSRATHLGHNHWKNIFEQFDKMKLVSNKDGQDTPEDVSEVLFLLDKCQHLSKTVNLRRSNHRRNSLAVPSFGRDMPPRITCDRLVHLYLRTFETVFRVLHVPTFQEEYQAYWDNPPAPSDPFHKKLLLVMAIGACFYYETEDQECSLRSLASKWIYDIQQWLVYTFEMAEPDMNTLQVSCLLLLARQIDTVGSELIWISADFPLRIGISQGLNKEPSIHFPNMPPFEAEMRKRLWATILEMSLQLSLDSGMPPPISCDDFDCRPPLDVDDIQISADMVHQISVKPLEKFTQSSVQIMLANTIRLRLKILQSLTTLKVSLTYQETLKLGSEIEAICRSHTAFIQSCLTNLSPEDTKPTEFQIKLLDTLIRRFILALHGPFAIQASTDLSYYFSRKVVAETSLRILAYPLPPSQVHAATQQNNDYLRLKIFGGGIFKHALWHASASLCAELVNDVTEDSFPFTYNSSRTKFLEAIQGHIDVLGRRVRAGDTNIEAYILFSCALAQISAAQTGDTAETAFLDAAKGSLNFCYSILEAEVRPVNGNSFTNHNDNASHNVEDGLISWDLMLHDPTHEFDFPVNF